MVIGITDAAGAWNVTQEIVTTGEFLVYKATYATMAPDDSTVRNFHSNFCDTPAIVCAHRVH